MPDIGKVEALIGAINMQECYRRRVVRGQDLNEWHQQLDSWKADGHTGPALELLAEIMAAVETIEQYDPREPQPYWYMEAAKLYRKVGSPQEEWEVLQRWLARWPMSRPRHDKARERFIERAGKIIRVARKDQ